MRRGSSLGPSLLVGAIALSIAACGDAATEDANPTTPTTATVQGTTPDAPADQRFPDVVGATATSSVGGWDFSVTISSPYDTPERYADAWRIVGPEGTVYGVRELAHDHASEQPFTRSLGGVEIPADVAQVTIEGRDLRYGWGGTTLEVDLAD